jgi:DnaJ-class molecular chaperone with C-terminal Zn finger domain
MNCWSILGIRATNNTFEIKKAYTLKLKDHHPEEDPEGFARIHEAYKEALKKAKNSKGKAADFDSENEPLSFDNSPNTVDFEQFDEKESEVQQEPEISIFGKFEAFYADVSKRIELESWKELFTGLTVDEQLAFCRGAGHFFNWHYHIPKNVWDFIDQQIDLGKNKEFRFHDLLLGRYYLDFDFIKTMPPFDYDVFFEHRLNAIQAFYDNDFEEAALEFEKANTFFDQDPMLLAIQSGCAYYQNDMEGAISYANRALAIYPKLECALINRSRAYIKIKKLWQAEKDCKKAHALNPKSEQIKQLTKLINQKIANRRAIITIFVVISIILVGAAIGKIQSVNNKFNLYLSKPLVTNSPPQLYTAQPKESEAVSFQNNWSKIYKVEIRKNHDSTKLISNSSNPDAATVICNFINKIFSNTKYANNEPAELVYIIYLYANSDELFSFYLKESSDQTYFFSSDYGEYVITQEEFNDFENWFNSLN